MSLDRRGMRNIKTIETIRRGPARMDERHVRQFQLAALELERSVRTKEKIAATARIAKIDARLREIEAVLRTHYDALGLAVATQDHESDAGGVEEAPPPDDEKRRIFRY